MPHIEEHRSISSSEHARELRKVTGDSSRTLTRKNIAAAIMRRVPKLSRPEAARILDSVLQEIVDVLMQGEERVKLHEFGTFYVFEKMTRKGRNPLTGRKASLPRRKSLKFRPSLGLKEKVEKNAARGRAPQP
jgi:nucleoid DNA-binding protein